MPRGESASEAPRIPARGHFAAAAGFATLAVLLSWPLAIHLGNELPAPPALDIGLLRADLDLLYAVCRTLQLVGVATAELSEVVGTLREAILEETNFELEVRRCLTRPPGPPSAEGRPA